LTSPRGAVGDDQHRRPEPTSDEVAAERLPVLEGLTHPKRDGKQHALAVLGETPRDEHAFRGPVRAHRDEGGVEEQSDQPDLVQVAALERLKALLELLAHPRHGRLRQLPEPGLLAQVLDVAHRQAAHERADHQRLQRLGPQQLGCAGEQLGGERLRRLADLRDLDLQLTLRGLQCAWAKPIAQPTAVVLKPALRLRPALIAGAAKPRLELILHTPLDDQPGAELRQLRQRLPRVLTDPDREHLLDPSLYLRRRRYGTSHGVGPPSWSCRTRGNLRRRLDGTSAIYSTSETQPTCRAQGWN
jgi:hypothetical protein